MNINVRDKYITCFHEKVSFQQTQNHRPNVCSMLVHRSTILYISVTAVFQTKLKPINENAICHFSIIPNNSDLID